MENLKETIKYSSSFVSFIDNEEWPHFLWFININGERFEYKTFIKLTGSLEIKNRIKKT